MDEYPKNLSRDAEAVTRELLRQSTAESDRNFWTGKRPINVVQWVGVLLFFIGMAVVATVSDYRLYALVLGAFVLFVAFGNRWARRKTRSTEKR